MSFIYIKQNCEFDGCETNVDSSQVYFDLIFPNSTDLFLFCLSGPCFSSFSP